MREADELARFEALARTAAPRLTGYLARRTDQPADAADLTADVLLVAWRRRRDLPRDEDAAIRFLYGVARGVLANHRRGRMRRSRLADTLRAELETLSAAVAPEPDPALARALAVLSPTDRELLTLVAWEELTPAQAAEVLGIRETAARKRLQRVRERMRALLAGDPPEVRLEALRE